MNWIASTILTIENRYKIYLIISTALIIFEYVQIKLPVLLWCLMWKICHCSNKRKDFEGSKLWHLRIIFSINIHTILSSFELDYNLHKMMFEINFDLAAKLLHSMEMSSRHTSLSCSWCSLGDWSIGSLELPVCCNSLCAGGVHQGSLELMSGQCLSFSWWLLLHPSSCLGNTSVCGQVFLCTNLVHLEILGGTQGRVGWESFWILHLPWWYQVGYGAGTRSIG